MTEKPRRPHPQGNRKREAAGREDALQPERTGSTR